MRLILNTENDAWVEGETMSELGPEFLELVCGSSSWIGSVSNDATGIREG